jgi:hypothetical protein
MSRTVAPAVELVEQPRGLALWGPALGGIGAWIIHITVEASLVESSRSHEAVVWLMQLLTVVTALIAAAASWLSWRLVVRSRATEAEGSPAGRTAFLGWFGLITGLLNVTLILVEGVYLVVIDRSA